MHDIKEIRENLKEFSNQIKKRNVDVKFDEILELDKENRSLIQEKQKLESEKKSISKSKDKSLFKKSKELTDKISTLQTKQLSTSQKLNELLSSIPNTPLSSVPEGKDESSNKEVEKKGSIKESEFKIKSHYEVGENLNMLDFDLATKTSGSRFVFVKNKLAKLERALSNFMIDVHTKENGYEEISPPLLANFDTCLLYTSPSPRDTA